MTIMVIYCLLLMVPFLIFRSKTLLLSVVMVTCFLVNKLFNRNHPAICYVFQEKYSKMALNHRCPNITYNFLENILCKVFLDNLVRLTLVTLASNLIQCFGESLMQNWKENKNIYIFY